MKKSCNSRHKQTLHKRTRTHGRSRAACCSSAFLSNSLTSAPVIFAGWKRVWFAFVHHRHSSSHCAVSSRVTAPVNGGNQGVGAPGALLQLMCPYPFQKGHLGEGVGKQGANLSKGICLDPGSRSPHCPWAQKVVSFWQQRVVSL